MVNSPTQTNNTNVKREGSEEMCSTCLNLIVKKGQVMWAAVFPALVLLGMAEPVPVSRIAFGSCANQSAPQPIWDAIIHFDPQLFIWMGDNIYGDIRRPFKLFGKERTIGPWKNVPRFYPSSEHEMRSQYHKAKSNPGYSTLRRKTKVIGTWDDHDYGLNDAGKEFEAKITNQRLLLDFLDEPLESTRRKQAGVYASYVFGPVGKQVKVISNHSATTGPLFYMESWGRFPGERSRLFKLISDSKVLHPVSSPDVSGSRGF